MIKVAIQELPTWFLRFENGKYYIDRYGKTSTLDIPREELIEWEEYLIILDRKNKLEKLLS